MQPEPADRRELIVTRHIAASPAAVYRCWTEPALMTRWFTLHGWRTVAADLDLRPGGASVVTMRDADGVEMLNRDQYCEVVPNERLVLTDAYTGDWQPSDAAFMTIVLTFDADADGTRFTMCFRHWSAADRDQHAAMGFDDTWRVATDALATVAATL